MFGYVSYASLGGGNLLFPAGAENGLLRVYRPCKLHLCNETSILLERKSRTAPSEAVKGLQNFRAGRDIRENESPSTGYT